MKTGMREVWDETRQSSKVPLRLEHRNSQLKIMEELAVCPRKAMESKLEPSSYECDQYETSDTCSKGSDSSRRHWQNSSCSPSRARQK